MAVEKRKKGRPKLTKDEIKNIKYTIRLDKDLNDRLQKKVKEENSNVTKVIRNMLDEYLD